MDEFKTNICDALMKQSLTLRDKCLNNKRNYNWKFKMNWNTQRFGMGEVIMLGVSRGSNSISLASIMFWILIFSAQQSLVIMPRTSGMICTYCITIVVWRISFRVWMRSYQRNQIHLQQVLQCLRQWHVNVGKLSLGSSCLRWFPLCCCRHDAGPEIKTAPTCWSWLLLLRPFWPYTTLDSFFPMYGFSEYQRM